MNEQNATPKSTSASRMQKMRKKLKSTDPDYQKQENKRIANLKAQQKDKMSEKEKCALRQYERDRKRLQRAKKKKNVLNSPSATSSQNESSPCTPYSTKATFSKAVWKVARSLPSSPRKQKAVVKGLAKRVGVKLENKMEDDLIENSRSNKHDFKEVVKFFFRPDIVYTCPGLNDIITVWKNGKKEKLQKHYLTMYLKEAFFIFKESNLNFEIGFSKFCSLRPKNVLLMKETPAHQCLCKIHQNFMLKLSALSSQVYSNEFWNQILCDVSLDSDCWRNSCVKCSGGQLMLQPLDSDKNVTWKRWEKNDDGRLHLAIKETCRGEIFESLVTNDLPQMMAHVNTKRIQQQEFENDKKSKTTRILQVDFAMSYGCEFQNEVQSALWARSSVLLFTAATFFDGKCKTYMICSDASDKGKDTVFAFLDILYDEIIRESGSSQPDLEVIWSDGPSSEFKNKYMVKTLQLLSKKYNRNFGWKYFATSHGKGVIDGVGGNLKRLVREKSMAQGDKCIVQSARDFAEVAVSVANKTQIFYVEDSHIKETIMQEKPWDEVQPVPGIQSVHMVSCTPNKTTTCKRNALATKVVFCIEEENEGSNHSDFLPDEWVQVMYEKVKYPGTITKVISTDEIEVSVMVPCDGVQNMFKWPQKPDILVYSRETVIRKLNPPEIVNNRGFYTFVGLNELEQK